MPIKELLTLLELKNVASAALLLVPAMFTLIQVSPIKINPWDTILKWFGGKINGELQEKVTKLENTVETVRREGEERTVSDMRWHILNFAYTCRNDEEHTKEQWNHVLDQAKKYETYIENHGLDNGVIEEDTKFIRELYNRLSREGKIK